MISRIIKVSVSVMSPSLHQSKLLETRMHIFNKNLTARYKIIKKDNSKKQYVAKSIVSNNGRYYLFSHYGKKFLRGEGRTTLIYNEELGGKLC